MADKQRRSARRADIVGAGGRGQSFVADGRNDVDKRRSKRGCAVHSGVVVVTNRGGEDIAAGLAMFQASAAAFMAGFGMIRRAATIRIAAGQQQRDAMAGWHDGGGQGQSEQCDASDHSH